MKRRRIKERKRRQVEHSPLDNEEVDFFTMEMAKWQGKI